MNKRMVLWGLILLLVAGAAAATYQRLLRPIVATVLPQEMVVGSITLVYPRISALPDRGVEEKLNAIIRQEMDSFATRVDVPQMTGNTQYAVQFNGQDVLSVTLGESFYAKGAAHPMSYLRGFTMNVRNGRVYQLQDLFLPDRDYATTLSGMVQEQMTARKVFLLRPFERIHEKQEFYLTQDAASSKQERSEFIKEGFPWLRSRRT